MGLQPDGDREVIQESGSAPPAVRPNGPLDTASWSECFRSAPFWQMSMAYVVCGTTTFVLSFHFVAFAQEDRGMSPGLAAGAFALMGGLNVVGGIGAGVISDRFSRKNLLALVYATRAQPTCSS